MNLFIFATKTMKLLLPIFLGLLQSVDAEFASLRGFGDQFACEKNSSGGQPQCDVSSLDATRSFARSMLFSLPLTNVGSYR